MPREDIVSVIDQDRYDEAEAADALDQQGDLSLAVVARVLGVRVKVFDRARQNALQSRQFAENAEFEALRNGAKREVAPADPLAKPSYAPEQVMVPAVPTSGDPGMPQKK